MTCIINKNIPVARPLHASKRGAIRAAIANAIGAVCLFGAAFGWILIGYGLGF